jgi:hypothetical protein
LNEGAGQVKFETTQKNEVKITYLVAVFAFAVELEVLAHFGSELVYVGSAWSEIVVDVAQRIKA